MSPLGRAAFYVTTALATLFALGSIGWALGTWWGMR